MAEAIIRFTEVELLASVLRKLAADVGSWVHMADDSLCVDSTYVSITPEEAAAVKRMLEEIG